MRKAILCTALSFCLILGGCSAKWVNVALADLPVLANLAASILALANPGADKDIQEYATEVGTDLQILKSLIDEYNAAPAASKATTQAKISAVLTEISGHLNDILVSAHVKNTAVSAHIAAAVQVAILTVNTISALVNNQKTTTNIPTPVQLQAAVDDLNSIRGK